jgi:hypothetical protein
MASFRLSRMAREGHKKRVGRQQTKLGHQPETMGQTTMDYGGSVPTVVPIY